LNLGKQGCGTIRTWARMYEKNGANAFIPHSNKYSYNKEFKQKVVEEYLSGNTSLRNLMIKYNIPAKITIERWIKVYNSHIDVDNINVFTEVCMNKTLKTTLQERIEIVEYCLEHGRNIKGTAGLYGCTYGQLYSWVRKYEKGGSSSLVDKRGKSKPEEELSDTEKLKRQLIKITKEKEEYRRKYEVLKKAEERERW